ncbi:MAG: 16S rRNA (cytosine(1402)-N(4))-methyltransferase RsmH [Fibromonadaceae bacterium]|jgi:16S rRNA (cytosine1402-N4)-methyltransferase|nr:16S rRNA (cytosine(1402)-N(4))-methyltransferase RsmH [Fibromonadaceae bacterium]
MIKNFCHTPVLLRESIESLRIGPLSDYADCTLGGGGHSEMIAELIGEGRYLHCFDRDIAAINAGKSRLSRFEEKIIYHHKPFSSLGAELPQQALGGILYDLGVSSHQIDATDRGFSFTGTEPLDMRMDASCGENAQEYLKRISEAELAKILRENSDLEMAGRLAKRILSGTLHSEKITATNLNAAIEEVYSKRKEDLNSLKARVFQAIRMEVNSEIAEIKKSVEAAVHCLKSGGRLCIITYHSKEARAVKETLSVFEKNCLCDSRLPVCVCGGNNKKIRKVNKETVKPNAAELRTNSRSRSAVLRVYERV